MDKTVAKNVNILGDTEVAKSSVRPFGTRDIVGYFMGDFGCNMSFTLISSYMFIFYTQFIGIELAHYSIIILVTKILDGINDPIIGFLVDKMKPNGKDKFKPWILKGGPILAIACASMFFNSASWSYAARLIFCILTYTLWDISYTVVNVPYGSLSSVITNDPVERTKLSTARSFGAIVAGIPLGIIIPMVVYKQVTTNGVTASVFNGNRMFPIALICGVVSIIAFVILYKNVEERITPKETSNDDVKYFETLKGFVKNRPMIGITVAALASTIFIMGGGQLTQMTYQLYFNDGSLGAYSMLTYLIPMILGAIFAPKLVEKFGKQALVTWPILGALGVYLIMIFVPITNPFVWLGLLVVAGIFNVGVNMLGWALVADAIDYQEWKEGHRAEGTIYATYSMMRKIGQGIGQALVPAMIVIIIPGLSLIDTSTWLPDYAATIKNLSVIFPLVGGIITFIAYKFIYTLDKKRTDEMVQAMSKEN